MSDDDRLAEILRAKTRVLEAQRERLRAEAEFRLAEKRIFETQSAFERNVDALTELMTAPSNSVEGGDRG